MLVALFALLAWDLSQNDGEIFWVMNFYVDEMMRQLRLS